MMQCAQLTTPLAAARVLCCNAAMLGSACCACVAHQLERGACQAKECHVGDGHDAVDQASQLLLTKITARQPAQQQQEWHCSRAHASHASCQHAALMLAPLALLAPAVGQQHACCHARQQRLCLQGTRDAEHARRQQQHEQLLAPAQVHTAEPGSGVAAHLAPLLGAGSPAAANCPCLRTRQPAPGDDRAVRPEAQRHQQRRRPAVQLVLQCQAGHKASQQAGRQ